jgi:protein disulfide-isomerase
LDPAFRRRAAFSRDQRSRPEGPTLDGCYACAQHRLPRVYWMKRSSALLSLCLLYLVCSCAKTTAGTPWETDFRKAQDEAKAANKLLLVDFTGSDWCGWCKLLNKEVFSKSEFQDYARKNLVLLEIDFPRTKQQTDALKKQNQDLAERYHVEGYPTIIVLNPSGRKVGELGYMEGGPAAFIAKLERLRKS